MSEEVKADNATIFADKAATTPEVTAPVSATTDSMVALLVGEGKKYKTVDDLAKAYISADEFIETLKAENHDLREKTAVTKTVDDVLERLQQRQQPTQGDTPAVSAADLTKLVEQTVTGLETKKTKDANLQKANAKMQEMFGERAVEVFSKAAPTPELRKVYTDLAAVDPDKFISLFGSKPEGGSVVDAGGGVNTTVTYASTNQSGRINQMGTKEYFDNVRRTNPKQYYSQSFQLEMDKAVRSNPDLYYGKK